MLLRKLLSLTFLTASLGLCVLAMQSTPRLEAAAGAHCHCKVTVYVGNDAGKTISNVLLDLGVVESYKTQIGHKSDCQAKCGARAAQDPYFNNKTWLCERLGCAPGEHRIEAYGAVGTHNYHHSQTIYVTCKGGEKICTCPPGWLSNTSGQDGAITGDGRCKKLACHDLKLTPLPPDGTQLGSWGFTWGSEIWAYGSTANGGAAACTSTPCTGQ